MNLIGYSTITQFTRHPTRTTESYRFISTREVLETFSELGWFPTSVKEAGVRREENRGYQRHLVRLQNPEFTARELDVGDALPEIVLASSHCGESAQQADSSLWSVFNTVQENIMRGGVRQVREDGTTFRSRAVKSVQAEVQINQTLWRLAANLEQMLN
jgi:hypothetical protein